MISQSTVSPAARVFSIGELCEAILLQADPADVIRSRRVNHKLLEVITHSTPLQRKLFLLPELPTAGGSKEDEKAVINPLAPAFFQRLEGYRSSTIYSRINLTDLWREHLKWAGALDDCQFPVNTESTGAPAAPLWRNMLIAQPPTQSCVIPVGDHMTICGSRKYPNGMRFGDLEKAVIAAFEIRQGRRASKERLDELSASNTVLIYRR